MVDIDISQFNQLKKMTSRSFNDQKSLIKKVLAGQVVYCHQCKQPLKLTLASDNSQSKICCNAGCTDIELAINL